MGEHPLPYPLQWPEGIPRSQRTTTSAFRTGLAKAMENVRSSLRLFGQEALRPVSSVVISSNAVLGDMKPADAGVAVWFLWDGEMRCIAVDRYAKVECNLQAIHHVLEARRVEMRHAGITMVRAAFKGFAAALPAPDSKPWWVVLDVGREATRDAVQAAYKVRARRSSETNDGQLQEINVARDKAMAEIAARGGAR